MDTTPAIGGVMMLNLKNGKVPIQRWHTDPIHFVDFPDRKTFDSLYRQNTPNEMLDKMYLILQARANGDTLRDIAVKNSLSAARIRQIEQTFLRLMAKRFS
jgi:hypothetical protein